MKMIEFDVLNLVQLLNEQDSLPTAYTLASGVGVSRRKVCSILNDLNTLGLVRFEVKRHREPTAYVNKKSGKTVVKTWDKNVFHVTPKGLDVLKAMLYMLPF